MKLIEDLPERMEKMKEMFMKDLEELKNKQTEMNNILKGINSRINEQKNGYSYSATYYISQPMLLFPFG